MRVAGIDATPWNDRLIATLQESGALRSAAVAAAFQRVSRHRLLEHYVRWQATGWVQQVCGHTQPRHDDNEFMTDAVPNGFPERNHHRPTK